MTPPRTAPAWRTLLVSPAGGAENMARDTGLMDRARETGESVFTVYSWQRPTLSLGRNQTARGHYDLAAMAAGGVDVVRRPTGGRALLHDREVTYSITAPVSADESLIDSYHRINRILISGLRRLGVSASESASASRTPQPGTLPCFATPADGELVSGGSKLVGSAQVRENGALLQHGSILIEDDQSRIAVWLMNQDDAEAVPPAATLTSALGRSPSVGEVAAVLFDALNEIEGDATPLDDTQAAHFAAPHLERYRSEWWTWRR